MLFVLAASEAVAGVEADIEASVVFASLNDTAIPGDEGTRISLVDDLSISPAPAFRLRLGYLAGQLVWPPLAASRPTAPPSRPKMPRACP
ncbi:MAG: hypothetical protein A2289_18455 [Deltaproteobacteria bacterium RIFOXYA12_FULL_58_15]|nr:MAG: hypothetical protein A2289_18455 [Deltaproteobacteria bacterium RIFOXYA12_FULL_58_15]OGR10592.1 MAG: hypothetical protein A2341_09585 [Deltaproteobacteria bacterium RIFOXYB12_FULL_58_9]